MEDVPQLAPVILVIFGITGDLAKRKVLPALYHLCHDNLLPDGTKIVGISRRDIAKEEIIDTIRLCVTEQGSICDKSVLNKLRSWLSMFKLDPLIDDRYEALKDYLQTIEDTAGVCLDRLYYLSIPPQVYDQIVDRLGNHGLNQSCAHAKAGVRLLVEKPFGFDVKTAEELIANTERVFSEEQIFRIDHYLAKETAQNILKFRRHNPVFSSQWNGQHIRLIHVLAKEQLGIEKRVAFYEQVGAMRDLVQSHLLQLLSLTAMEMPKELTGTEVHAAKHAFISNLIPPNPRDGIVRQAVRGQYASYKSEVNNPHSQRETFVSLVLASRDPRWKGTIFQLTTGKALDEKETVIRVYFGDDDPNILSFRIQPNEGIDIDLIIEQPGFAHNLRKVKMNFSYSTDFGEHSHDAYERVLVDAIRGDKMLFATKDEVLSSWHLLQPILDAWQAGASDIKLYANGSQGPDISHLAHFLSTKLSK
jgi:glucose-6-phosphate 1-dehydrogenase